MLLRPLALLLAWVCGTLGANVLGSLATVPPPVKKFSHRDHVPAVWFEQGDAETWRDCRGCHRFTDKQRVSAPQRECDQCHAGQGLLVREFQDGWKNDLAGHRTRTRDAFRHHTHAALECRQCHLPKDAEFGSEDLRITTGPGSCLPCHEAGRVDAATVGTFRWFAGAGDEAVAAELGVPVFERPSDAAEYATRLTTVFAGPTGGLNTTPLPTGGDFHHGDHLAIVCADCHRTIQAALANEVGTGAIPVAACKQCHVRDAQGTAVAAAPAGPPRVRELAALGTFAHRDHYGWMPGKQPGVRKAGVCSDAAYASIEKGCTACHTYVPSPGGLAERDFPFGDGTSKESYLGCQSCHDVPGWATGETKQAPRHASSGPGAANGAGWQACTVCHLFGGPDLAGERPQVLVQRWSERTFVFPANTHPDITQRGIDEAQRGGRGPLDCRDCHRARVPELSTRLVQKQFRHDVHLPADAPAASCLECHPTAAQAQDGPTLAPGDFRTYTLASCTKCHWGGNVTETAVDAAQPAERRVVAFPHGPHVTTAKQACAECHVLGADGRDVGTKPEALACRQCHDHVEGGSRAEQLFGEQVQSCARCHHDSTSGPTPARAPASVPPIRGSAAAASDRRFGSEQAVFAGFADPQFHPLGPKCSECHKDDSLVPAELRITDHLAASKAQDFHGPGPKQPIDCLRCHWKPVGEWTAAVNGSLAPQADKDLRARPQSPDVRKKFGNATKGYPGTESAKG